MWCKHCQQDVPGIADSGGATVCVRCASVVRLPAAESKCESPTDAAWGDDPPIADDWQLDEQLSEAERLLKVFSPTGASASRSPSLASPPGIAPTPWDEAASGRSAREENEPKQRGGFLAWTFLLAGTTALVCGGVLALMSWDTGRATLWNLSLPILFGGQGCLLLGIVLQVVRMWHNGRNAARRLAQVDRQLGDLKQTTTLLGNTYGAGSSTFFAHLAEGASPHMLLADLKGQMDLLATKMSRK